MDPELDEPDLRSYLGTISRRKWLVAAVAAAFLGIAAAMSFLADPQYEVRARVQTRGVSSVEGVTSDDPDRVAEAELAYIEGFELAVAVERIYTGTLGPSDIARIDARETGTDDRSVSSVIELTLVTADPEAGADLMNVYARTYVEQAQHAETEYQLQVVTEYLAQISTIDEEIATEEASLDDLRQQIADIADTDPNQADLLRDELATKNEIVRPAINELSRERTRMETLIDSIQTTIQVTGSSTSARVLSGANAPTTPVSPNIPRNLAIGMVFGLFLGIAAAFLRDYFDDSVKSKDIVERVTGAPALGLIPRFDTEDGELVAMTAPGSPATEAFRSLRTSVKFLGVDRDVRIVQITSPSAGEGKTLTATNLATVLAQAGDRIVLVGADLRRPRAEEILGAPLTPGLTEVLIGEVALPQAIRQVEGVPNLAVLPSGHPPPNPSELLSNERARRLMDVLAQTYDLVVLDCPPVLPVTDSLVLARMADTTLLVTSARRTSRRELERAIELLNQINARPAGTVITSLDPDESFTEPYGYDSIIPPRRRPTPQPAPAAPGGTAPPDETVHANHRPSHGGDGWMQQVDAQQARPDAPNALDVWRPEQNQ